jgi:ATP-dependent phosphoenolpyruvate carboxykinase
MALSRLLRVCPAKSSVGLRVVAPRALSTAAKKELFPETPEFTVFPNQYEGNIYADNWSLVEDGVTPTGNAYRNARHALLASHAGLKDGKGEVAKPAFEGKYSLKESGAGITHDEFKALETAQCEALIVKPNLFVEDAGLGAHWSTRVGVRVTTSNAATALIARNLLVWF